MVSDRDLQEQLQLCFTTLQRIASNLTTTTSTQTTSSNAASSSSPSLSSQSSSSASGPLVPNATGVNTPSVSASVEGPARKCIVLYSNFNIMIAEVPLKLRRNSFSFRERSVSLHCLIQSPYAFNSWYTSLQASWYWTSHYRLPNQIIQSAVLSDCVCVLWFNINS